MKTQSKNLYITPSLILADLDGKLQVILLSAEKIVLAHVQTLFGRSNRDAF